MMPAPLSLAARAEALLNRLAQVESQEADRQARLEIEKARLAGEQQPRGPGGRARRDPGAGGVRRDIRLIPACPHRSGRGAAGLADNCHHHSRGTCRRDRLAGTVPLGQPAPWKPRTGSPGTWISALNRSVEKKRQEILPPGIDQPIIAYPGASDALAAQAGGDCRPCCSARSTVFLRATWRSDSRTLSTRPRRGQRTGRG